MQEQQAGEVTILVPQGRIDSSNAKAFESGVLSAIDGGSRQLLLDLGDINYMASAGLRVLLLAAKRLQSLGGKLVLCSLSDRVHEVLKIAGFNTLLDIRSDRESALAQW